LRFPFAPEARVQLRAIDRPVASRILQTIARFGESGVGDVSPLHGGEWQGCFRLRCGNHRAIFRRIDGGLEVIAVGHRSEIYK